MVCFGPNSNYEKRLVAGIAQGKAEQERANKGELEDTTSEISQSSTSVASDNGHVQLGNKWYDTEKKSRGLLYDLFHNFFGQD